MRNSSQFTVGADPEFFVRNDAGFTSAYDLVPGTKAEPFEVPGGAIQVDGMALEINVNPARDRATFLKNIRDVMRRIQMQLPPTLVIAHGVPVAEFGLDYIMRQPPEAAELGCTPDYNGWTGSKNPVPDAMMPFRTASGHIHLGWEANVEDPFADKEHFQRCCAMAQQMDYFVGIYSLLWDPDNRRRDLYGKAGAFRPKSYGMEYRVPSTAWLADENLQGWVFEASLAALKNFFGQGDGMNSPMAQSFGDAARHIIDNNEVNWQERYEFGTGLSLPYQQVA